MSLYQTEQRQSKTTRILVYPNITYSKDLRKDSYIQVITNMITELNKIGVDPALITEAQKKSTKPKKGNTYYNVEVKEDEG